MARVPRRRPPVPRAAHLQASAARLLGVVLIASGPAKRQSPSPSRAERPLDGLPHVVRRRPRRGRAATSALTDNEAWRSMAGSGDREGQVTSRTWSPPLSTQTTGRAVLRLRRNGQERCRQPHPSEHSLRREGQEPYRRPHPSESTARRFSLFPVALLSPADPSPTLLLPHTVPPSPTGEDARGRCRET